MQLIFWMCCGKYHKCWGGTPWTYYL